MNGQALQTIIIIPYRTFKEKIRITKYFDRIAKMQIEDKYVYIELKEV